VQNVMGISTTICPSNSPQLIFSYNMALLLVNRALIGVPGWCNPSPQMGPSLYAVAVYNLAGNNLIEFGVDLEGADDYRNGMPFFAYTRQVWNINGYVSGTISSAGDEGTSEGMVVPEWAKKMTLADLQTAKTPYGRMYLGIAQQYGPSIWGYSGPR